MKPRVSISSANNLIPNNLLQARQSIAEETLLELAKNIKEISSELKNRQQ
jgi:hypothetical protein